MDSSTALVVEYEGSFVVLIENKLIGEESSYLGCTWVNINAIKYLLDITYIIIGKTKSTRLHLFFHWTLLVHYTLKLQQADIMASKQ